jgi:hypothetical protein
MLHPPSITPIQISRIICDFIGLLTLFWLDTAILFLVVNASKIRAWELFMKNFSTR